jgi:hypothetical protein
MQDVTERRVLERDKDELLRQKSASSMMSRHFPKCSSHISWAAQSELKRT